MTTETYLRGPIQKLNDREFDDPDVRKIMDGMTDDAIAERLGPPHVITRYAPTRGNWSQGDPLPPIRDEDPAVMQAIGRCAVSRIQLGGGKPTGPAIHDEKRCAWCAYPLPQLLAACDWGVFRSRYIEAEFAVWHADPIQRRGPAYMRPKRSGVYDNPTWAAFWDLPKDERQARIRAAQYPEETR